MAEERDDFIDRSDDERDDVEAHKHFEDESKRDTYVDRPPTRTTRSKRISSRPGLRRSGREVVLALIRR
jgi:hypothetical protein